MKKNKPPRNVYALFDRDGIFFGAYLARDEAEMDAYGPRLRKYTIREYRLVPRKSETKDPAS